MIPVTVTDESGIRNLAQWGVKIYLPRKRRPVLGGLFLGATKGKKQALERAEACKAEYPNAIRIEVAGHSLCK